MKPEQIRQMYDRERAAGMVEAGETIGDVLKDPELARMYIKTVAALAPTDEMFSLLFTLFCQTLRVHADDLESRMADDAFALGAAAGLVGLMDAMKPGSMTEPIKEHQAAKVLRGRPKPNQ